MEKTSPPIKIMKHQVNLVKSIKTIVHLPKSDSNSSKRTRAASVASFVTCNRGKKSKERSGKKNKSLNEKLLNISTATKYKFHGDINKINLFVDGGIDSNPRIIPQESENVNILHIKDEDLFVPKSHFGKNDKGLCHREGGVTSLVLCPRHESLDAAKVCFHHNLAKKLSEGYASCIQKANDIKRGKGICIESSENSFKYGCIGSASIKNGKGWRPLHHVMTKLKEDEQVIILQHVFSVESLFEKYMETAVIRNVKEAIKLVNAPLLQNAVGEEASFYQSFAVGKNVYLSCHIDKDFTYSAVTIVHHEVKDKVVAYFNFPRLGLAIPLKPFDVLFFNPSEPHMISSRCHNEDDIYCISFYLKTGLMGGNDNDLELTDDQKESLKIYEEILEEKRKN